MWMVDMYVCAVCTVSWAAMFSGWAIGGWGGVVAMSSFLEKFFPAINGGDSLYDSKNTLSADGDVLELDAIIYLIGVQELGQLHRRFKKDQKLDLMHIAICTLLEPYGFYEYEGRDRDDWPHWKPMKKLPRLSQQEQEHLIKKAILEYFDESSSSLQTSDH